MSSAFTTLRERHPSLTYRGYSLVRREGSWQATFLITLAPAIEFRPTLTFPVSHGDEESLRPFLFHLGMVELISYWKLACPPRVVLEGVALSDDERAWWHDLFMNGLGEFFFVNDIDPSDPRLLSIEGTGSIPLSASAGWSEASRDGEGELVLAAGGKDSSLALEMLRKFDPSTPRRALLLNPSRSASESVAIAGYGSPIVVQRTIDKRLLELNAQGYLNGHTPFSAYLAFLGTMIAGDTGLGSVIVANERSASEENTVFHGLAVNHQYSKGIRFERRFREYASSHFPGAASYYSLIRPLYDLQVSGLFARFAPRHLSSFRSCNVGQREDRWCGRCPKCAFVCLTLAPFLDDEQRANIFGKELFGSPEILSSIEELTGVRDHKPLECVGTLGESRDALVLAMARWAKEGHQAPEGLVAIANKLKAQGMLPSLDEARRTLSAWSDDHELPVGYAGKLHESLKGLA